MFEQFFSLVRLEIDERIGRERKHPVAREPVKERSDAETDRGQRQEALQGDNHVQSREFDRMSQYRRQAAAVDFLFTCLLRCEHEAIAKQ